MSGNDHRRSPPPATGAAWSEAFAASLTGTAWSGTTSPSTPPPRPWSSATCSSPARTRSPGPCWRSPPTPSATSPASRRDRLRPARGPDRPQEGADLDAVADRRRHLPHRSAPHPRPGRHPRPRPPGAAALRPGRRRRRRVGRRGAADQGVRDPGDRGFWASAAQVGPPPATCWRTACSAAWPLCSPRTPSSPGAGGWRSCSPAVLVAFGLWIRTRLEETPVFKAIVEHGERPEAPSARSCTTTRAAWPAASCAGSAPTCCTRCSPSSCSPTPPTSSTSPRAGARRGADRLARRDPLIPLAGWLSDRIDRRLLYAVAAVGAGIWVLVFLAMTRSGSLLALVVGVTVALALHAFMYGPQAAYIAEQFHARLRYTGTSLAYTFAGLIGGAVAPAAFTWLLSKDSSGSTVAAYVGVSMVVTLVGLALGQKVLDDVDEAPRKVSAIGENRPHGAVASVASRRMPRTRCPAAARPRRGLVRQLWLEHVRGPAGGVPRGRRATRWQPGQPRGPRQHPAPAQRPGRPARCALLRRRLPAVERRRRVLRPRRPGPGDGGPTAARAYLITAEQFADVAAQEMYRLPQAGDPLEEIVIGGLDGARHHAGPGHYETLVEVGPARGGADAAVHRPARHRPRRAHPAVPGVPRDAGQGCASRGSGTTRTSAAYFERLVPRASWTGTAGPRPRRLVESQPR